MKHLSQKQNSHSMCTKYSVKKDFLQLHKSNAITLVALVVTIIVLLILAGISINLIAGSNGILQKATNAVSITEIASAKENAELLAAAYVTDFLNEKYVEERVMQPTAREYITANSPELGEPAANYWFKVDKTTNRVKVFKNKDDAQEIVIGTLLENGAIDWRRSRKY